MTPVLVTTVHRGVYFGYMTDDTTAPDKLVLTNARVAVSWDTEMRGFLALADVGPNELCRISRHTPQITLFGISTISECTAEAAAAWNAAPWSS
jgi:hypothetical protein